MVNLLMLRGNIGRPGAGACPVRGHSNVQGDRTMGIWEKPPGALLDHLREVFGFEPPRQHGWDTVESIRAMRDGRGKVFFALGGNFAAATPDTPSRPGRRCAAAISRCTSRPSSIAATWCTAREALILPCLGRTEVDRQAGGLQGVSGRRLDEHSPHVGGHQRAGLGAPAVRAGDRRRTWPPPR